MHDKQWANRKNKKRRAINSRINNLKFHVHGIPYPQQKQQQQQQQKRVQPPGEGRWVKPVDSPNVEAVWVQKSTETTTTWEPLPGASRAFLHFSSDEE